MKQLLAQFCVDQYVAEKPLSGHRLYFWALGKLRSWLVPSVALVGYRIGEVDLKIPFSHNLFIYKRQLPDYSENLGRLAGFLARGDENCKIIDIGANVGDSAAIIRKYSPCPILCIEGEQQFYRILMENQKVLGDVELEMAFVNAEPVSIRGTIRREGGTARVIVDPSSPHEMQTKTLAEILENHRRFEDFRILKIDTDGYDLAIIRGGLDLIERHKPVLFFEYDPATFLPHGDNGLTVLRDLEERGFGMVLIYDNKGDLLVACDLSRHDVLLHMNEYFSGRNSRLYGDFVIFPRKDDALARGFLADERCHFAEERGFALEPAIDG